MIQLEHLHIEEFRGIRSIDLPLGSKSFVIYGPNGSGKSGVVDAIDFVLTGNIGRLVGSGTGGVTLAKHGPHVHQRDNPAAAIVALTVKDVGTGITAVLTRSIKDPHQFKLEPDSPTMREAIMFAQLHPELTLSRREIIKYVVSKPADRSQEVQSLLKLERLDRFRKLLRSALGKTTSEQTSAQSELRTAEQSFMGHLDISSLLIPGIAREINSRREVLGLDEQTAITIDTKFIEGFTSDAKVSSFNLATAIRETAELNGSIISLQGIDDKRVALTGVLDELAADPGLLDALKHRVLVENGLDSLQSSQCPLCDKEWDDMDLLREHIQQKLERSNAAQILRQRINMARDDYTAAIRALREQVDKVVPVAEFRGDDELPHLLRTWSSSLLAHAQSLVTIEAMIAARSTLSVQPNAPDTSTSSKMSELETRLKEEPDQTATDAARTFLTVAQDRWTRVRLARAAHSKASAASNTAKKIYDEYCRVADESLTSLYNTVEGDFSAYYQKINADDEGAFKAAR